MGRRITLLGAALGLALWMSGCAAVTDRGTESYSSGARAGAAARTSTGGASAGTGAATPSRFQGKTGGAVTPAVATDGAAGAGAIQQTAGVVGESTDAFKRGVVKVSAALTPSTTPAPVGDPTSLTTKGKPTPETYLAIARYQEQSKEYAAADQSYQQALKLSPNHLKTLVEYAGFKERQGSAQEALALYQKAVKAYPTQPSVFNNMGVFYARQGKNKEAVEAYEKAIKLKPSEPRYRNNVAVVLVDTNQPEKAMTHLKAVYGEAPACYNLGYLLEKKGQLAEAAEYYGRALKSNPAMQEAQARLANVQGQLKSAPQVARRVPPSGQPVQGQSPAPVAPPAVTIPPSPRPSVRPGQPTPPVSQPLPNPGATRLLPPATGERKPLSGPGAEDAPLPPSTSGNRSSAANPASGLKGPQPIPEAPLQLEDDSLAPPPPLPPGSSPTPKPMRLPPPPRPNSYPKLPGAEATLIGQR